VRVNSRSLLSVQGVGVGSYLKGGSVGQAQIELRVEFDVVDEDGELLEPGDEKWEDAQAACIEAIMDKVSDAVSDLDFSACVDRE
jgi:hypothetical protein